MGCECDKIIRSEYSFVKSFEDLLDVIQKKLENTNDYCQLNMLNASSGSSIDITDSYYTQLALLLIVFKENIDLHLVSKTAPLEDNEEVIVTISPNKSRRSLIIPVKYRNILELKSLKETQDEKNRKNFQTECKRYSRLNFKLCLQFFEEILDTEKKKDIKRLNLLNKEINEKIYID